MFKCIWVVFSCPCPVQKHVLCPDKPRWGVSCCLSCVCYVRDSSKLYRLSNKSHKDPSTNFDCSPTYTNNLSTLNQLLEVRACWHDLISSAGNRHVVPYSHRVTWVTGMEERLSSLCEDIKEQSPRPNTPSDHNTLPGKPRITQQTADSSGQIRGLRRESCSETQWHS